MIDEGIRKKITYTITIILVIVGISAIIWFVFFKKDENLPPEEPITVSENTDKEKSSTPVAPKTDDEETPMIKNGITFKNFDELSRLAITNSRIDLIQYYLAEHANTQSTGIITAFTLDKSSIRETKEGEGNIMTFTTKDNRDTSYTVELSYTYSTDTYVRILDKNNTVLQQSPYDTD